VRNLLASVRCAHAVEPRLSKVGKTRVEVHRHRLARFDEHALEPKQLLKRNAVRA
jgi:hypothetical protein